MREILPGVHHWETLHPRIQHFVSSYWLEDGGVLFDPLIPEDVGIDWFANRSQEPATVILTNRHHLRESVIFRETFGCPILCNSAGLYEFTNGEGVEGFDPPAQLPGHVRALELGGICPDDTALHVPSARALAFADGIVRSGGPDGNDGRLGFVPDSLMDDPPATKQALLEGLERLLEEASFENVLLAHGAPLIGDGRERVQELVAAGGRSASEL
jgi:glyoxylase-like metal-dependent hydrolase (beta-lactamase superfamily II)